MPAEVSAIEGSRTGWISDRLFVARFNERGDAILVWQVREAVRVMTRRRGGGWRVPRTIGRIDELDELDAAIATDGSAVVAATKGRYAVSWRGGPWVVRIAGRDGRFDRSRRVGRGRPVSLAFSDGRLLALGLRGRDGRDAVFVQRHFRRSVLGRADTGIVALDVPRGGTLRAVLGADGRSLREVSVCLRRGCAR